MRSLEYPLHLPASMRPRHKAAENLVARRGRSAGDRASMRPRHKAAENGAIEASELGRELGLQ